MEFRGKKKKRFLPSTGFVENAERWQRLDRHSFLTGLVLQVSLRWESGQQKIWTQTLERKRVSLSVNLTEDLLVPFPSPRFQDLPVLWKGVLLWPCGEVLSSGAGSGEFRQVPPCACSFSASRAFGGRWGKGYFLVPNSVINTRCIYCLLFPSLVKALPFQAVIPWLVFLSLPAARCAACTFSGV